MKRSLDDDTRQHGDHYRKTQRRRSRNTSRQPIQRYQNYSIPPAPTNVPPYPQQYQLVGGSVEQAAWPQQLQPNYQDTRQRSPSSSSTLIYNQVQPQIQQLQGHQQQQQQYPHHLHQQEQQRRTFRPYVIPSPAAFDYRQQYQQTVQYPYNQYRFVQVTGIPSRANLSDIVDICLGSGVLESVTRSSRQIPSHALIGFVEPADAYQFITRLGRPYSILGKFVTVTWASRQDTLESRSKLNQHLALGHTRTLYISNIHDSQTASELRQRLVDRFFPPPLPSSMSSIQTSASSSTVISSPPVAAVPTAAYSESGTSHDLWTSTSSSHAEDPNDIIDQVFIMRSKHCAFISTSSMDWGEKMVESLQSEWKYEHRISYGKDRCALKNRT